MIFPFESLLVLSESPAFVRADEVRCFTLVLPGHGAVGECVASVPRKFASVTMKKTIGVKIGYGCYVYITMLPMTTISYVYITIGSLDHG